MIRGLIAALLLAMPAFAQVSALPPEAREAIRRVGPTMGAEGVAGTAAAIAPLIPPAVVAPLRDLPYGTDERHRLDVFTPGPGARPVLVFVHGGGFTGGDKTRPGAFYYDNVAQWAVRAGFVGVNITYRLAPRHTFPSATDDVANALEWVRRNIQQHGGDPQRIVLMGHSAGAAHVADLLARQPVAPRLAAAVLVSGVYDVDSYPPAPTTRAYYTNDAARRRERAPLVGVPMLVIPYLIVRAELEPTAFRDQAERLQAARCAARASCPPILDLAGHNHFSSIFAIGTADTELTNAILAILPP